MMKKGLLSACNTASLVDKQNDMTSCRGTRGYKLGQVIRYMEEQRWESAIPFLKEEILTINATTMFIH